MGGCTSCQSGSDGVGIEDRRRLDQLNSSPSGSQGRSSKRWMRGGSGSGRRSERRGGSVSERIYGIVDFGFLSRGAGGSVGREEELHRVPGRMFLSGASDVACLHTQQGRKGTNQDAMLVWENFASRKDTIFCGVFDGHGPFGHMVAKKVRDSLPLKLSTHLKANGSDQSSLHENNSFLGSMDSEETGSMSIEDDWCDSMDNEENEKLPEMFTMTKQSLLKAFKLMDKDLKMHPSIDCFCSGTTAVTLVKQGQDLVIGNIGDSRAVLGTRDNDNILIPVQLTVDLKPNLPREAARIQQCRGRVFALQDEPEVARVWLPNNDSPGLAMARAFGDFCLKDFGLISVPDVSYRRLTERDEFIILATDGVWDVLSNKEAVDIVASAPCRATAARAVVENAVRAWRLKFPTSKSDDCAAVCLFLDFRLSDQDQIDSLEPKPVDAIDDMMIVNSTRQEANMRCEEPQGSVPNGIADLDSPVKHSGPMTTEIVPVSEPTEEKVEMLSNRCLSTKSLAEYIATAEDDEWSALEGITRVNSLVNLPRFGSGDRRSPNWRKCL